MTFDELTSRLDNVKHTGPGKILASCPCHQGAIRKNQTAPFYMLP